MLYCACSHAKCDRTVACGILGLCQSLELEYATEQYYLRFKNDILLDWNL